MRCRPTALALFIVLAAGPALAQDGLVWIDGTTPEAPALIYGLPNSDHVVLALACDPATFALTISFTPDDDLPPVASAVTLTLTSDGGKVMLPAARVYLEMLDTEIVEAAVEQLDPALVAILTTGTELAVDADGVTMRLPIPDEATRAPFLTACAVTG